MGKSLLVTILSSLIIILAGCGSNSDKQGTQVIAHRGYWKCEGGAQNSVAALKYAAEAEVYGSEFDVWVTSDGVAVLNHDKDINGIVVEKSTYDQIKDQLLPNGEKIPTLKEFLEVGALYPDLKLVLELKDHASDENDIRAVNIVIDEVRSSEPYKNGQIEFISFNYDMCKRFASAFEDIPVSYLKGDKSPEELKKVEIDGIDYHHAIISLRGDWVTSAHERDMTVNVWTVNKDSVINKMIDLGVDFITTDEPLRVQKILESRQ